jgi:tRNA pseudouridine32 synthase / 23S rRNA pseudouridine746 synthase
MSSSWLVDAAHDDFIVAAKPAGVSFHGDGDEPGFVARLREATGLQGLHPVHRLDRITSGLILLARHAQAARDLGALFEGGQIEKYYLALSDRKPSKSQGWIKGGMEKSRGGSWRLVREGGVPAVTQFFSYAAGPGLRLLVVRPRTGRTHQIRVALKSVASPILGDERYGGSAADRGYLHAWALRFTWQGRLITYRRDPDEGALFLTAPVLATLATLDPFALPWPRWQAPAR